MKTRDAYYDNAKFFLIFFVVFGHFIQSYITEDKFIYTLYTTIYSFHMPAFILISGYFSKGFNKTGYVAKITKKLLIPYLIFQGIYSLFYFFLNNQNLTELNPLNPQWSLWFLISLFCWNLMLFVYSKWKPGVALIVAFAVGITVGYFEEISNFLSLSRTFVFFPFFLLGYVLKKEHFEKFRDARFKYISFFILVTIFIGFYLQPDFNYQWLFGSKPYAVLETSYISGGIIRLGVYFISLVATLSILALIPEKQYVFTKWGMSSIYVYLLHGFFIKFFRNSELVGMLNESAQVVVLILISIILVAFLSSKMIRKLTQPFVEFKLPFGKRGFVPATGVDDKKVG